LGDDAVAIDCRRAPPAARRRVIQQLDIVREQAGISDRAEVASASDFPTGAGLASSASAFAALTLAASAAARLDLPPAVLSRLARRGSGSASRSIFGGFVEWRAGDDDGSSYAEPIAGREHWPLVDLIAIITTDPKEVGSTEGHQLAETSPFQAGRIAAAPLRLEACRRALIERDFDLLAEVVEHDCHVMHAVMQTSSPPLLYWTPASVEVMRSVRDWRAGGQRVGYTLDAGPNVHCLCPVDFSAEIAERLRNVPGVTGVLAAGPGEAARLLSQQDPLTALL
jgi:diphosphomevalonate decarboxylase